MKVTQLLRWLGGILLAVVITLGGAISIVHYGVEINFANPSPLEFWATNFFLASAFALFVLLACWFAPLWKRNAAVFVVVFTVLFISFGIYNHITYDGFLASDHIIRYSTFLLFQGGAVVLSYKIFRDKSWVKNVRPKM